MIILLFAVYESGETVFWELLADVINKVGEADTPLCAPKFFRSNNVLLREIFTQWVENPKGCVMEEAVIT